MASAKTVHLNFLDFLDGCEAANIFQHLSRKPNHPLRWSWPGHGASEDVVNVLNCGGAIRAAAQAVLTRVDSVNCYKILGRFANACVIEHRYLCEVFTAVGGKLTELFVTSTDSVAEGQLSFGSWVAALAENVPGLIR